MVQPKAPAEGRGNNQLGRSEGDLSRLIGVERMGEENSCAAANQKRNNEGHDTTPATKRYVFGVVLFQDRVVGLWKWFRGRDHFVASARALRAVPEPQIRKIKKSQSADPPRMPRALRCTRRRGGRDDANLRLVRFGAYIPP
jgi:hypothetical protein